MNTLQISVAGPGDRREWLDRLVPQVTLRLVDSLVGTLGLAGAAFDTLFLLYLSVLAQQTDRRYRVYVNATAAPCAFIYFFSRSPNTSLVYHCRRCSAAASSRADGPALNRHSALCWRLADHSYLSYLLR